MESKRLRILVPIDGSPEAETILPALMPIIRARPVEIVLNHVVYRVSEAEEAMKHLLKAREILSQERIPVSHELGWGKPAVQILRLAEILGVDLIAMTTHGRGGLRRVLMGSVAEEVVRHANIPLLINRPGTRIGDWDRIIVALDGSTRAEGILPDVIPLAREPRASIHVLKVNQPILVLSAAGPVGSYVEMDDPRPYLEGVCARLRHEGLTAIPETLNGAAGDQIVRYARGIDAGLIAMTTHGRTGLSRAIVGSVAEAVLRAAPCPVLVRKAT